MSVIRSSRPAGWAPARAERGADHSKKFTARRSQPLEHHHGDFAVGLLRVLVVVRPDRGELLPQLGALLTGGGAGTRLELVGLDLHADLGVLDEVEVPAGV